MTISDRSPIFVVGTGRSGSTIIHKMLCMHPGVAWLNRILSNDPSRTVLHKAYLRLVDFPGIGGWLMRRGLTPAEAYEYWNEAYRGFGRPMRDLTAEDVTERARSGFTAAVDRMATAKRPRPLAKVTGWPRIRFLAEIFEDAHFIHVVRDGRAVANSLMNVSFWEGWHGPNSWRFGPLPEEYEKEWLRFDRSFVVLAGIAWKIMLDAMIESEQSVPSGRILTIRYEDFCNDPLSEFRSAAAFTGLEWTKRFERRLERTPVRSRNEKWRTDLTRPQQEALNEVLRSHLERFGYLETVSEPANVARD